MKKTAWDTVLLSRKADRPTALDYINAVFDEFIEFHGDRYFKDDGAIVGGIAMFHGMPVTVIGQQKGKNTKDNIKRNFGMPSPDGYRKALRLMKQAETFGRPIVCFVDTPGAFCGLEAEERGQGEAIARNLFEMSDLKVPILSIVIGEGGSGGALAMAVADEVWMLENAIYSILSPEGFASILYKDSKKAPEAAEVMKVTAADLKKLGLIEKPVLFLGDYSLVRFTVILVSVWKQMPFMMITLLAGLQSVPAELYEAAEMDGAGFRHTLTGITLPLIKPISFISTILTFLWTFNTFENIWLLTGGGPLKSTYFYGMFVYDNAFKHHRLGYAASNAWVMFLIILVLTSVVFKSSDAWVFYESEAGGKKKKG